jgi:parallel beta-helix repeat protein
LVRISKFKSINKRSTLTIGILFLLCFSLIPFSRVQGASTFDPIYIHANGSIDPSSAPISTTDNVTYTQTGNITSNSDGIIIEKDNIKLAGNNFWMNGPGTAITMIGRQNVTIQNMQIKDFSLGIYLDTSQNNTISGSKILNSNNGVYLSSSSNNTLKTNTVLRYSETGINVGGDLNNIMNNNVTEYVASGTPTGLSINGDSNIVSANTVINNWAGIQIYGKNDILSGNTISSNIVMNAHGICLPGPSTTYNDISYYIHTIDTSNTIQGKPVYYWINHHDETVPSDGGFVGLINCSRIIVENMQISRDYVGVMLVSTTNSTIKNNQISNSLWAIWLDKSTNNILSKNNVTITESEAIRFDESSSNNLIVANRITQSNYLGIYFSSCSDNIIQGNIINGTWFVYNNGAIQGNGVATSGSNNITFSNNLVTGFGEGVVLGGVGNTLTGNNITGNQADGLTLTSGNTLRSNTFTNNGHSILMPGAGSLPDFINDVDTSNTVNGKPVYYWVNQNGKTVPSGAGYIVLVSCSNINVNNQVITNENQGILLASTTNSLITQNNFTQNTVGIMAYWSSGNTISQNSITENAEKGIWLWISCNSNTISGNTMTSNGGVGGLNIWEMQSYSNFYSNNNIQNCQSAGIRIEQSSSEIISGNDIGGIFSSGSYGGAIILIDTTNVVIQGNQIKNNGVDAILLSGSPNNFIVGNNIENNWHSIRIGASTGNTIYHNSFVGNNPWIMYGGQNNKWDNGYPSGGNYWDTYTGIDQKHGPAQDIPGADGIGDSQYVMDASNIDNYPLMTQWNPTFKLENSTSWFRTSNTVVNFVASGDVNGDGQVEIVTGGSYFDGSREVAELIVWNGSSLVAEKTASWFWTGNTTINSVAVDDVDGDGQTEIVTGGSYFDGTRNNAQLIEWKGSDLTVDRLTGWFWTNNTVIKTVALGDVDSDGQMEIITGGTYFDGSRDNAQLIVWSGSGLAVKRLAGWAWTGNTVINSVALGELDNDGQTEIVTGGYYFDGTRNNAQLVVWSGSNLAAKRIVGWYWTSNTVINSIAIGEVDGDGQVEIISGGSYNDGIRDNAQVVVWNGVNLAVDRLTGWRGSSDTRVSSIVVGDFDGNGQGEIVTGGQFNDGTRNNAQLVVWSGSNLAAQSIKSWYLTGSTVINSVAIGDVSGDFINDAIAGGKFHDGTRLNSQLTVWGMS